MMSCQHLLVVAVSFCFLIGCNQAHAPRGGQLVNLAKEEAICCVAQDRLVKLKVSFPAPKSAVSEVAIYDQQENLVGRYSFDEQLYRDGVALIGDQLIYCTDGPVGQVLAVYDTQSKKRIASYQLPRETYLLKIVCANQSHLVLQLVDKESLNHPYLMIYDCQTQRCEDLPKALWSNNHVVFNLSQDDPLVYPTAGEALLVFDTQSQKTIKIKDAFTKDLFQSLPKVDRDAWWFRNTLMVQVVDHEIVAAFIRETRQWYFGDLKTGHHMGAGTIPKGGTAWYSVAADIELLIGFESKSSATIQQINSFGSRPSYTHRAISLAQKQGGAR